MAAAGGGRALAQSPTTHGVMARVEGVDAQHERAQLHGARIVDTPSDFPSGERQCNVEDLAGHRWTFSKAIVDVAPEDWDGQSGRSS